MLAFSSIMYRSSNIVDGWPNKIACTFLRVAHDCDPEWTGSLCGPHHIRCIFNAQYRCNGVNNNNFRAASKSFFPLRKKRLTASPSMFERAEYTFIPRGRQAFLNRILRKKRNESHSGLQKFYGLINIFMKICRSTSLYV